MNTLISLLLRYLGNVSASQWKAALDYVLAAAAKISEGDDKRMWVIDKLRNVGVTGWIANLLTEVAVAYQKKRGVI